MTTTVPAPATAISPVIVRSTTKGASTKKITHFSRVARKDLEFLRNGVSRGLHWANKAFRIPQVSKTVDDLVWLRNLEDSNASLQPPVSWPQPSYQGLTGVDLFMADLEALKAYGAYFNCLSKTWSKPLPEVYDAQKVADYFNCRPHLVAFRLFEIFTSFAIAAIRIRTSGNGNKGFFGPGAATKIDSVSEYKLGMVLKETMLCLGPTFIKVGQSLSTRPDIIGTEISKALSGLNDQIPPFPRAEAMQIIEGELGSPVESFFSYISEEPVAAASFGQVYFASTLDGLTVAVKVQRPNLRHVVVRDIYILRIGLGLLQKIAKRKSDIRLYADELGKGLVGELDYNLEAANAYEFLEAHSSFKFMCVPKVLHHLTQKRVLTMEWMVGESPTDLLSASSGGTDHNGSVYSERQRIEARRRLLDLVNKGVEATLVQLLETGLLHADPHAGNLRYTSSGQIGFLDYGLLCRMEKKHQFAMLAAIVHIVLGDWESLAYDLVDMDIVRPGINLQSVILDMEYALGEAGFENGIPDLNFSKVLGKIFSIAIKYHFRMPPYFTLLLRSLASFEGLAIAGDSNFKTFEAAYPYVFQKLLTENSAETNKILYSVVLNKKKEFQWGRLSLLLRAGVARKSLHRIISIRNENSVDYLPSGSNNSFDLANLVLKLLRSKDGVVLRRLWMTADGVSFIESVVSEEAKVFRDQFCRVIADMLYSWISKIQEKNRPTTQVNFASREFVSTSRSSATIYAYVSLLRDRRLKLIFGKMLKSATRKPKLMVKFYWTTFVMFVTASALACHRVVVSLSEAYFGPTSLSPGQYAMIT